VQDTNIALMAWIAASDPADCLVQVCSGPTAYAPSIKNGLSYVAHLQFQLDVLQVVYQVVSACRPQKSWPLTITLSR